MADLMARRQKAPIVPPKAKRSKYGAVPTVVDGIRFDSRKEADRWLQLQLLERAGKIRCLERQPAFHFQIDNETIFTYRADFVYFEGAKRITEDCKGFKTPLYKLKKKLVEKRFGVEIIET